MKKTLLILVIVATIFSCSSDDCGECSDFPNSFLFEIVDKDTGENLFTNGTYNSNEITMVNTLSSINSLFFNTTPIRIWFNDLNDANIIAITGIGLETEIVNMRIIVSGEPIFDFYVDTERIQGECCYYNGYNEVEVREAASEYDSERELYRIFVNNK